MPPPTIDAFESVPPHIADVVDPMLPLEGEDVAGAEPDAFRGGPVDLSLLPLYPDHIVRHIWDGDVALVGFIAFY